MTYQGHDSDQKPHVRDWIVSDDQEISLQRMIQYNGRNSGIFVNQVKLFSLNPILHKSVRV